MTTKTFIRDGTGSSHIAKVSHANELVVSGIGEVESKFNAMTPANTAFNFFPPKPGQAFYITSILFNTPGPGAIIDIYEASSSTSITIDKQILKMDIGSRGFFPISFPFGGFLPVAIGSYLNAKTDTATVNMTMVGLYKHIHIHP